MTKCLKLRYKNYIADSSLINFVANINLSRAKIRLQSNQSEEALNDIVQVGLTQV